MRIARAFQSEIESVFVEDEQLFDCAAYGFVREVSLTGRRSRAVSRGRHDAGPAARGPGRAAAARGPGAAGGGAAALARGARRAAARAVDRLRRDRDPGTWWRWPSRSPAATAACSKQLLVEVSGATGLVMVGPRARRVTGPTVIAVEDADRLPALLRAAERLTALDGAQIVLLLIAPDEERLDRMDGQVRLVVEAREDVRIEMAEVARGEAAVIAEALRRLQRRLRHLPVRRPGRAGRGQPQAAGLRARVSAVPGAVEIDRRNWGDAVRMLANLLVALVALLHVGFLVLEMFLWTTPFGLKTFNMTRGVRRRPRRWPPTRASTTASWRPAWCGGCCRQAARLAIKVFFLGCVIMAGVFGAATAKPTILFVQALPAALALALRASRRDRVVAASMVLRS